MEIEMIFDIERIQVENMDLDPIDDINFRQKRNTFIKNSSKLNTLISPIKHRREESQQAMPSPVRRNTLTSISKMSSKQRETYFEMQHEIYAKEANIRAGNLRKMTEIGISNLIKQKIRSDEETRFADINKESYIENNPDQSISQEESDESETDLGTLERNITISIDKFTCFSVVTTLVQSANYIINVMFMYYSFWKLGFTHKHKRDYLYHDYVYLYSFYLMTLFMFINPLVGICYYRKIIKTIAKPKRKQIVTLQYVLSMIFFVIFIWELKVVYFFNLCLKIMQLNVRIIPEAKKQFFFRNSVYLTTFI